MRQVSPEHLPLFFEEEQEARAKARIKNKNRFVFFFIVSLPCNPS